ncbi:hypothetical protein HELRODRAFT_175667 [Helobdella robusta]|uniref:DUF4708 domain-containing protein n=1 Tax=Helobdella robusta TaxID=6412 RepID=T1F9H8_HELRO|nr:hypothetical protein HELRODRAFT_175667 [Helobdella robusta]ESO00684.1 hypothetical protein HELRODRAFT_175667 [Helobdella robusta]
MYFFNCPDLENLFVIYVKVPDLKSYPQAHVSLCKNLIFTEPDVLASPFSIREKCFLVCMSKKLLFTKRIQNRLIKKELSLGEAVQANPETFEMCLRYTVITRLSPNYNVLASFLVEGERFLFTPTRLNAIDLNIHVTNQKITMNAYTCALSMPVTSINHFGVHFNQNSNSHITPQLINCKWCFVLPSLKKGKVCSIHKSFPLNDCFKCYRELKIFWRDIYGYVLPENESDVFFVKVGFGFTDEMFLYPSCCVKCFEPIIIKKQNDQIVENLINNILEKVPFMCGNPLKFHLEEDIFEKNEIVLHNTDSKCLLVTNNNDTKSGEENDKKLSNVRLLNKVEPNVSNMGVVTKNAQDNLLIRTEADNPISSIYINNTYKMQSDDSSEVVKFAPKIVPRFTKKNSGVSKLKITNVDAHSTARVEPNGNSINHSSAREQVVKQKPSFCKTNVNASVNKQRQTNVPTKSSAPIFNIDTETPSLTYEPKKAAVKEKVRAEKHNKSTPTGEPKEKKFKPQIEASAIDIENLLKNEKSLNKDVLIAWLKSKNVKCNAKMKKEELISKVRQTLNA